VHALLATAVANADLLMVDMDTFNHPVWLFDFKSSWYVRLTTSI